LKQLILVCTTLLYTSLFFSSTYATSYYSPLFYEVQAPAVCSIKNQNRYVYEALHDSYLWRDEVPYLDSTDIYSSPEQLLKALKNENDFFSHIVNLNRVNGSVEDGKFNNFGLIPFLIKLKSGKEALAIVFVYPNSPAQKAGLKRGDIITKIDNITTRASNLERIKHMLRERKKITFTFWKNGKRHKKRIVKYSYSIHTISHVKIYHIENKKVGYMVLSDFISSEKHEIDNLFRKFKSEHIDDLILDLRYNGGGDTIIANHIASLVGGAYLSNKVSTHYLFNSKYSNLNYTMYFEDFNQNQLNLNRLIVITSKKTCSASEQLIKNLKASGSNIDVIQIGQQTCGKPYAYNSLGLFCHKALFLLNTKAKNSDYEMIGQNGLYPTCPIKDDIYKEFGDQSESSLREALYYVTHNQCSQ